MNYEPKASTQAIPSKQEVQGSRSRLAGLNRNGVPLAVPSKRRGRLADHIAAIIVVAVVWIASRYLGWSFGPWGLGIVFVTAEFAGVAGWWLTYVRARNRLLSRLSEFNNQICLRCAYPLYRLPESGACPECGAEYDAEDLAREWIRWRESSTEWG